MKYNTYFATLPLTGRHGPDYESIACLYVNWLFSFYYSVRYAFKKKSFIWETRNLSTDVDSNTDTKINTFVLIYIIFFCGLGFSKSPAYQNLLTDADSSTDTSVHKQWLFAKLNLNWRGWFSFILFSSSSLQPLLLTD